MTRGKCAAQSDRTHLKTNCLIGKVGILSVLCVLAMGTGGALALDLTGTWSGSYECKAKIGFFGGPDTFGFNPSTLKITQGVGNVPLALDIDDAYQFNGAPLESPNSPDKGEAAVVRCGTTDIDGGEVGRIPVTTKPTKGSGTFSGTSIFYSDGGLYTCKWKYKRKSTMDPGVPHCPPP
jgi:hypothetical protein